MTNEIPARCSSGNREEDAHLEEASKVHRREWSQGCMDNILRSGMPARRGGHRFLTTTIAQLMVLTALVAVCIASWQYMYPIYIEDHPHEVYLELVTGWRDYFDSL